ncbi:non-homologous end joining protein Ku [Streptomyces sp. NPDC004082]|uniref:non-homologous end joining protein Ku n=1 Tax=unclassified Streptomyces TaxID=2593676 RepID=UPI0033AB173B
MPRPVWSGAISFGLVTIPVKVISVAENHSISFRQIHLEDLSRVRYRKVCELDGQVLTEDEIGKGYELTKDTIVPVADEELREMPLPTAKAIDVVAFVPAERIDAVRLGDSYYLQYDGQVAAKPYKLLSKALERTDKVAIIKMAWHGRERLGQLRVVGDGVIALQTMYWPDEVRSPQELAPKPVEISERELREAVALMDVIGERDISEFHDEYREALEQVIEAKVEGKAPPQLPEEKEPAGKVMDLMAALQASVSKAKEARGEGEDATVHEMPAKKAAAKKTTKAPAKKTAAKKAPAKRSRRSA